MPRKPREKEDTEKKPETGDRSSWSEDQKEREYYYDDSHGYETFDPSEEEPECEDD